MIKDFNPTLYKEVRKLAKLRHMQARKLIQMIEGADMTFADNYINYIRDGNDIFEKYKRMYRIIKPSVIRNKKIQAIKEFRSHTGLGLKDSKFFVDAMEVGLIDNRIDFLPDKYWEI